ncbi:MAG: response regulator [Candidatus Andersenbacteria bacterium]|nr:response regulator [Candidatus Andersenbacteria bacterium]
METPRPTILILEDDNFISTFLKAKFDEQFDTIMAADTAAARQALDQRTVDLIILDIILPREDGYHFLQELKKSGSPHRRIPVIILSNIDDPADIKRGLKLGAMEFLIKANQVPEDIVRKVATYLTRPAPGA